MLANGLDGCSAAVPPCNACGRPVDLVNPFLFLQDLEECGGGGGGAGCGEGGGGCGAAPPACSAPSCAPPSDCGGCCAYSPLSVHWSCSYYNPPYCCPIASCPTPCSAPACCPATCSAPACCPATCIAPACCPVSCSTPACCPVSCSAPACCPAPCSAPACCPNTYSAPPCGAMPSACQRPSAGGQCPPAAQPPCGAMPMQEASCPAAPGSTCPVELTNPFFFVDDLECGGGCGVANPDTQICCGSLYEPLCNTYENKGSIPYGISGLCGHPITKLVYGAVRTNLDCLRANGLQDTCHLRGQFPPCRPCG